jgi:hypothetical protein
MLPIWTITSVELFLCPKFFREALPVQQLFEGS